MTEDVFPSVKIVVVDGENLRVTLPTEPTAYPQLPTALHNREIPSFVLEWVVEADEVGVIIQELLQAPTRSLCRIMPTQAPDLDWRTPVRRPFLRTPGQTPPGSEVTLFRAEGAVPGLPEGIQLPGRLLTIIEMARRVEGWIEKGRRVREWLDAEGLGDVSWLPTRT